MVSKLRTQRIAERIQQDLSQLLLTEVHDPRLAGVTITGVKVDRELAFADVYFSCVEGSQRSAEILEGLNHAQGFYVLPWLRKVSCEYSRACVFTGIQLLKMQIGWKKYLRNCAGKTKKIISYPNLRGTVKTLSAADHLSC
jgi:ribosome-binding factor A